MSRSKVVGRFGSFHQALTAGLMGLALGSSALADYAPPALNAAVADKFTITTFAEGLNFPKSMQRLSDGSLIVATSKPNPGGNFFNSTGEIVRLVDANNDGKADGPPQVIATGLPGSLSSLRVSGDLVFATSSQGGSERISVLRLGSTPGASLTPIDSINFRFPSGWEHTTYALAVRSVPGSPNQTELFFNIGSQFNSTPSTSSPAATGLVSGNLNPDSIYRVTITDNGGTSLASSGLEQVATGLRNAAGIAFNPKNGDLYFEDNGIDGSPDPNIPLSADELNKIAAGDVGGSIENFGFSTSYVEYRTGTIVNPSPAFTQPVVAFQPLPNTLDGSKSEGPAEIAFAPTGFPPGFDDGVFIGFHGKFNLGGLANDENPLVFYDLKTGKYIHFIENDQPGVGHLDGLLATDGGLFVADISATGNMFTQNPNGVIYLIRPVPEPAAFALMAIGLGAGLAWRRRRKND